MFRMFPIASRDDQRLQLRRTRRVFGERGEKALEEFVASGKGLVLYHFALAGFAGWTEFEKMSGANWRPMDGDHSPRVHHNSGA